jgi:two-component system chemotaxis response regulator CheY
MQTKTSAQIEQEHMIEAAGLLRDDLVALYEDCTANLVEAENALLDIAEKKAAASSDLVNRIFRAFHSVKGAACHLLHEPMKNLSQAAENVLSQVRESQVREEKIELDPALAEILLSAVTRLKEMAADVDRLLVIDCHIELASLNAVLNPAKPTGFPLHLVDKSNKSPAPTGSEPPTPIKALVVEDELTSRIILQDLLSKYGYCHVAVNGKEAVEAFRSALVAGKGYNLICMDIRMPVMDGTDAVRQIRFIEEAHGIYSSEGVKIFMTTSIHDVRTIARSFKALCDTYLFKPIDATELNGHLRAFRLIPSLARRPAMSEK